MFANLFRAQPTIDQDDTWVANAATLVVFMGGALSLTAIVSVTLSLIA